MSDMTQPWQPGCSYQSPGKQETEKAEARCRRSSGFVLVIEAIDELFLHVLPNLGVFGVVLRGGGCHGRVCILAATGFDPRAFLTCWVEQT